MEGVKGDNFYGFIIILKEVIQEWVSRSTGPISMNNRKISQQLWLSLLPSVVNILSQIHASAVAGTA